MGGSKKKKAGPGNKSGEQQAKEYRQPPEEDKLREFKDFYEINDIIPDGQWRKFIKASTTPPNFSFRFIESYHLCPSHIDTVPGVPSQAIVLKDYMKMKHVDILNKLTVEDRRPVNISPVSWYPDEKSWLLNMSKMDTDKYLGLKPFDEFLNHEKSQFKVQVIDTFSMLPIHLVDIEPNHTVLDLCGAPGFIASQVCEALHSDPFQYDSGLLIVNDLFRAKEGVFFQWTQGTKVAFSNFDARRYPNLYIDEKKTLANSLRYDRVIVDPKCSNDGIMRRSEGLQEIWRGFRAMKLHTEEKQILKRALELVKVKGQVLYTTTSMNPIENEAVIMALLKECEGVVELVACKDRLKDWICQPGVMSWKVVDGRGNIIERYSNDFEFEETVFPPELKEALAYNMDRCVRVMPQDNNSAGFFCAVLVKNMELPWIKGEMLEEIEVKPEPASKSKQPATVPEGKEYGYTIDLKCHIAVEEIEWVTETTGDDLETSTETVVKTYTLPSEEISPLCQPTALVPGVADKFAFCEQQTPEWIQIKDFFQITDDFDPSNMRWNGLSEFYQSTSLIKTLTVHNRDLMKNHFGKGFGVGFFFEMPEIWIDVEPSCRFMMSNEAIGMLYPYIRKQMVEIERDDLLKLVYNSKVKISNLSEVAQAHIKETDVGCILFSYKATLGSQPSCNIVFNGVRNETYCIDFRDGDESKQNKHMFRLAGMEWDDYVRKSQEDKLAAIVAKYKAETATAMETS